MDEQTAKLYFNAPVDPKALGLVDYFDVIKASSPASACVP